MLAHFLQETVVLQADALPRCLSGAPGGCEDQYLELCRTCQNHEPIDVDAERLAADHII